MEEVLTRRFRNYLRERDEGAHAGKRFAYPPNLLLIDGGKGQLGVAVARARGARASKTSASRASPRGSRRCTCPGESEPVRIPRDSEALYLLQQVRDEAHRFAITYHRQLRGQEDDDVGARRRRRPRARPRQARLLKEFGSVKKLRELDRGGARWRSRGCPTRSARPSTHACTASTPDARRARR